MEPGKNSEPKKSGAKKIRSRKEIGGEINFFEIVAFPLEMSLSNT
jgi:hypothetical protein